MEFWARGGVLVLFGFGWVWGTAAEEPPQDAPAAPITEQPARPADGRRQADLPVEAYAVVPGTKFLVRLEDDLDTKETREERRFKVKTLEPLEARRGIYLPPRAAIRRPASPLRAPRLC